MQRMWWARLTGDKARYLQQLSKNIELCSAFDALLSIPGLWGGMSLEHVANVMALHCGEVILTFNSFWPKLTGCRKSCTIWHRTSENSGSPLWVLTRPILILRQWWRSTPTRSKDWSWWHQKPRTGMLESFIVCYAAKKFCPTLLFPRELGCGAGCVSTMVLFLHCERSFEMSNIWRNVATQWNCLLL